ncbi:uncharacterized protein LOC106169566 [Lingula anatina]|uniref:Uncharacterized protein LOC106169566 n=1 Tax=Lingula anatina TaxID=7574 RepID=A0A1S3J279_LINAN|nr:uncharacterized protein LOC106169566 [Lingula anatina]|eukprot:XP_013404510.1 uncharacterized protein LOC106169566 [Lingula anatina]
MTGAHILKMLLTASIILAVQVAKTSGVPTNAGTEFIIGFTENVPWGPYRPRLLIVTDSVVPVAVTISSPLFPNHTFPSTTRSVRYNDTLTVDIPLDLAMKGTALENKGILITATENICVFGVNRQRYSNDGFIAIPTSSLSVDYYAVSSAPVLGDSPAYSQIALVATSDATDVNIELNPLTPNLTVVYNGFTYRSGDMIHVVLNRFQTFQVQSNVDFTGTKILASRPIFALSGNMKTSVGGAPNENTGDHLVETLPPVNTWGTAFVLVPTSRPGENIYTVIGSQHTINVTLQCGETTETHSVNTRYVKLVTESHSPCYVESVLPVSVYQFSRSVPLGRRRGDPFAVYLQPTQQFLERYSFPTPNLGGYKHYINIISRRNETNGLRHDYKPIVTNWTRMTHGYSVTQLQVSPGRHVLSHETPGVKFGAYVYGKAFGESYAFPAGLGLLNRRCRRTTPRYNDGIDNDCDGRIDEELFNIEDDDGDGLTDEDYGSARRNRPLQPERAVPFEKKITPQGQLGEFGGVAKTRASDHTVTSTSFTTTERCTTAVEVERAKTESSTFAHNMLTDTTTESGNPTSVTEAGGDVEHVTRKIHVVNQNNSDDILSHNSSTLGEPLPIPYDLLLAAVTPLLLIALGCILIILICRRFRGSKKPPTDHRTAHAQTSGDIVSRGDVLVTRTAETQTEAAVFVTFSQNNCPQLYSVFGNKGNPKVLNKQSSLVSIELSRKCQPHAYNFTKAIETYKKKRVFDKEPKACSKTSPKLLRVNPNVYMTSQGGRLDFPVIKQNRPLETSRAVRVTDIDW